MEGLPGNTVTCKILHYDMQLHNNNILRLSMHAQKSAYSKGQKVIFEWSTWFLVQTAVALFFIKIVFTWMHIQDSITAQAFDRFHHSGYTWKRFALHTMACAVQLCIHQNPNCQKQMEIFNPYQYAHTPCLILHTFLFPKCGWHADSFLWCGNPTNTGQILDPLAQPESKYNGTVTRGIKRNSWA